MMQGKVGNKKIIFENTPQGKLGESVVIAGDVKTKVKWVRDDQGIWIETEIGFFGYDVRKSVNDDGQASYALLRRNLAEETLSTGFLRAGEEQDSSSIGKIKKAAKIKSQMPGKIIKVFVKVGDAVKKGQALLTMEAMKMENEIKATQDGVIKEVKITEGQAIETGSELLILG